MRLTTSQKRALRSLVEGFGPLSYRERDLAKKYIAMGLLKTNNIKDPAYINLTAAGRAALEGDHDGGDVGSRDPLRRRHWSQPYHGVSHLLGVDRNKGQITLEEHGSFVDVYALRRGRFTPVAEKTFRSRARAQHWGETYARRMRW